jgi:hypothetical protein
MSVQEVAVERLPIFRLEKPQVDEGVLVDLGARVFDIAEGFAIGGIGERLQLRRGEQVVEVERASGGVWAADHERWYNPAARPTLPEPQRAIGLAEELGRQRGLLPGLSGDFGYGRPVVAGTHLAVLDAGRRSEHQLDVQVVFPTQVGGLPVVGGGGDFTIALGDGGELIGFTGVWRGSAGAFDAALVPRERSDAAYRRLFADAKGLDLEAVDSYLAYYAAPGFTAQEFLYPVYVHLGTARIADRSVPLRAVMLPATDFGPQPQIPPPAPARPKRAEPTVAPQREGKAKRSYSTEAGPSRALAAATKPWEAGTSWIGMSGGLAGSQANAQGFVDQWAADGWNIDFNWGDAAAFESDWRRNDDLWVDNADFVFYTGHASMNGWVLSNPDDGFLSFTEV